MFLKGSRYLVLVGILTAWMSILVSASLNPEHPASRRPDAKDQNLKGKNFIIDETLEGTFQIWKILYWSTDQAGKPVQTTARAIRPMDGPVKKPGLIWNHGGRQRCTPQEKLFDYARLGYVVIGADYQGCEGLGEMDPFFATEVYDVIGTLDWLKSHPEFVDVTKIYMVGNSRGGAITLRTLNKLSELGRVQEIRAAVVQGTVYSWDAMIKSGSLKNPELQKDLEYFMAKFNLSKEDLIARYRASLPEVFANRYKIVTPIFIAHGADDIWVIPENSERLAADLAKMGVKHRLKLYPGARHSFEGPILQEFLRDCRAWFEENS